MNFLDKLERKIGRFAIPNLSLYLVIGYAIGYLLELINPIILQYMSLNPYAIMRGQVWRIFTWVLIPPEKSNIFFVALMCVFYYAVGTNLERTWGRFYYNVYIFGGLLITLISSFILAGVMDLIYGGSLSALSYMERMQVLDFSFGAIFVFAFSTYYVSMSIFLAYAMTYPNNVVLLMFILPIRVKWLGIVYGVLIIYDVVAFFIHGNWFVSVAIVASLLNFLLFVLLSRKKRFHRTQAQKKMAYEFKKAATNASHSNFGAEKAASGIRHKCAICGVTDNDAPGMSFRFCSKCEGNFEYCANHLYTHEHVKRGQE